MSDPLSIAAGIVGILTAAGQISKALVKFKQSVVEAPEQAQVIITEVNDMSGILSQLQTFVNGEEFADDSIKSMLRVDQVVSVVSGCVLTFSELEKLLDDLETENMHVLDRMKWCRKEATIAGLILRLQNHKSSLSLILNILNATSITEAKKSMDHLFTMVKLHYQEILFRLQVLEGRGSEQSIHEPEAKDEGDMASILTVTTENQNTKNLVPENPHAQEFDFLSDLQNSQVYKRNVAAFRESGFSLSTRSMFTSCWSCFSHLSMADISIISVINLPITADELFNNRRSFQTWSGALSDTFKDLVHNPDPTPEEMEGKEEEGGIYPCRGCGLILMACKAFKLAGNRWHIECFRCHQCGIVLDADANGSLLGDGSVICEDCSYSCNRCKEKIKDLAILAGDQAYCAECFCCQNCKNKIEDLKYARTSQGIFCADCHDNLMAHRKRKGKRQNFKLPIQTPSAAPTTGNDINALAPENRNQE